MHAFFGLWTDVGIFVLNGLGKFMTSHSCRAENSWLARIKIISKTTAVSSSIHQVKHNTNPSLNYYLWLLKQVQPRCSCVTMIIVTDAASTTTARATTTRQTPTPTTGLKPTLVYTLVLIPVTPQPTPTPSSSLTASQDLCMLYNTHVLPLFWMAFNPILLK